MSYRVHFRPARLALVLVLISPAMLCAQLPDRVERCLPYPTLAREIREMQEEVEERTPEIKIVITSIEFEGEAHLSDSIRSQIIQSIKRDQFYDDPEFDWLKAIEEVGVRGVLQDWGYFRATVKAYAHRVDGDESPRRYSLTLRMDAGPQYRLGTIRFENARENEALAFSPNELREQIHLNRGELFNASKYREGIDEIRRLYGTRGYIDFTMEPVFEIEEDRGLIDVVMKIDEQRQYRVGKIEFWGLDAKTQTLLTLKLKPGEVFNGKDFNDFFADNKALLPTDAKPEDVTFIRNVKEGIVDMRFDLRACPVLEP